MKIFKAWSDHFRHSKDEWLLLHKHGEYEYRNPDSVYVHSYMTFPTMEDAAWYLEERIAPADREQWVLYKVVG